MEIAGINPPGGRDSRISPTHNFREHRRVNYFCARSIFCSPISSFARLKYFLSPSLSSFFFLTWKVWREKEGRNWRFHRGVRGTIEAGIFVIFSRKEYFWNVFSSDIVRASCREIKGICTLKENQIFKGG